MSNFIDISTQSKASVSIGQKVFRVTDMLEAISAQCGDAAGNYKYFYSLLQVSRVGHTAVEPSIVCKRFNINPEDLCVLIPAERSICNESLLNWSLRGAGVIAIPEVLCYLLYASNCAYRYKGLHFIGLGDGIVESYMAEIHKGAQRIQFDDRFFETNPKACQLGKLFSSGTPFVVVHNREGGWFNNSIHNLRNSNPLSLIKSIKYLLEQGYRVVRIGDKTMTRLPPLPGLIDLPFYQGYQCWMDLYAIRYCTFYLGTLSGPYTIAELLQKPLLTHNAIAAPSNFGHTQLTLYKSFYSNAESRYLSYTEYFLKPTLDTVDYFATNRISVSDCSEDSIYRMVHEYVNPSTESVKDISTLLRINQLIDGHRFATNQTPFYPAAPGINIPSPSYFHLDPQFLA